MSEGNRFDMLWFGWRRAWPPFGFGRFTGGTALLYRWYVQVGPFEVRRWAI